MTGRNTCCQGLAEDRRSISIQSKNPRVSASLMRLAKRSALCASEPPGLGKRLPSERAFAKGFSVLELLIALALLGTLLALAWSILGTYRSAQQRGWDQNYRLQLAAVARQLVEDDVLHWSPTIDARPNFSSLGADDGNLADRSLSQPCDFRGTEIGFSVIMTESLDPLPWLEYVLSGGGNSERVLDASDLYGLDESANNLAEDTLRVYPFPQGHVVRLSYSLQPEGRDGEELMLRLERSIQQLDVVYRSRGGDEQANSAAERVLDSADLYRLNEDQQREGESSITTHRLRGLVNAKFRYFDGREWRGSWNSTWQTGLPRAIELSFDYPSARSPNAIQSPYPENGLEDFSGESILVDDSLTTANSTNVTQQPLTEANEASADLDSETLLRDVRIVVLVTAGLVSATRMGDSAIAGGGRQ